jgi:2-dehydropantoate 2-reductase
LTIDGIVKQISGPLVSSSLEEALAQGPFDAAIFAFKSNDTHTALEMIAPYASQLPPFLDLQNGVENEAALAEVLGAEKVIAGTVTSAIGRRVAGNVVLERKRGIGVAAGNPISHQLVDALNQASLNAHLYSHPADMKWSKMLTNLLGNASSAILDLTPAEIFTDPRLFALETRQIRECLQVMKALKIRVVDLPGTPVRLLAFAMSSLPLAIAQPLVTRAVSGGRGTKMPSFHIDLHSRKGSTEADYLNGAVVRFGEKAGVPTPVNQVLNQTLMALSKGKLELDDFRKKPEKLLALIE